MMTDLGLLIKKLLDVATEGHAWLVRANKSELPLTQPSAAATTAMDLAVSQATKTATELVEKTKPAKRTRKPRAKKEPVVETATEVEMTEEQSAAAALDMAKKFIGRFKDAKEGDPSGLDRARAVLTEQFKVAKISDLVHAQRIQFITVLKAEIEKADAVPA